MANQSGAGSSAEPMKFALEYESFLANVFHSFTGRQAKLRELNTGEYIVEYEPEPDIIPICNTSGGQHVVTQLRNVYNKHAAFGNLEQDDIAIISGDLVKGCFNPMFVYATEYGVQIGALSKLENAALNLFDGIYIHLTALREAGLREFGAKTITVTYVEKQPDAKPQEGLYVK